MSSRKPAPKKPKRTHQTRYGEGSFRYVESKGLWTGRYDTGDVTPAGKRIILSTSARDEDEAWRKFVAMKKEYALNEGVAAGLKRNQTIKGWAEEWLTIQQDRVRSGPFKNDQSHVNKWIIPQIGSVRLGELTAAHMRKIEAAVAISGRSSTTAGNVQRTLVKMLNAAVAEGYMVPERIFASERAPVAKSERSAMSKADVQKVFALAYETYDDAVRLFLSVLYGSRKSEVLGLTWDRVTMYDSPAPGALVVGEIDLSWQVQALSYVDKGRGEFHIKKGEDAIHIVDAWHFTRPKTDAGVRKLPLIAPVAAELEAWRQKCPTGELNPWNLVFPRIRGKAEYLGYPRNKRADLDEWKDLQRMAGVYKRKPAGDDPGEFFVLHEARHSMISMMSDAKVPKHIIEMLVGQTSLVEAYVHGSMELAGEAVMEVMAPLLPRLGL